MKPPYFWRAGLDPKSRESAPLIRALLTPLAGFYAWVAKRKIETAKPFKADIPVICIGNLTVGGAGKSPVVAAIRARLAEQGFRASSLSRGYGGRLKGPLKVDENAHLASDVGDEPLMLAATGTSWIGADRPEAAKAMAQADNEVIIMDDGHQNPSIHKDLSLIVIDAGAPFGNGFVIPKGPLREPVSRGLSRADAVILMGDGSVPEAVINSRLPVIRAHLAPTAPPPKGPLIAFAGIGRPQKFFDSLTAAGGDILESVPFSDHHTYSVADLTYLRRLAAERSATLITTTKDHTRLPASSRSGIEVFPVEAVFEDTAALDALIANVLKEH